MIYKSLLMIHSFSCLVSLLKGRSLSFGLPMLHVQIDLFYFCPSVVHFSFLHLCFHFPRCPVWLYLFLLNQRQYVLNSILINIFLLLNLSSFPYPLHIFIGYSTAALSCYSFHFQPTITHCCKSTAAYACQLYFV
jgi:hypothetical protein